MALFSDFLEVTINGSDRTSYVIDYSRFDSLCDLGSEFTITFASEIPAITTYDSIVVTEKYDGDNNVVLRGFILMKAMKERLLLMEVTKPFFFLSTLSQIR